MVKNRLAELQARSSHISNIEDLEMMSPLQKSKGSNLLDALESSDVITSDIEQLERNIEEWRQLEEGLMDVVRRDKQTEVRIDELRALNLKNGASIWNRIRSEQAVISSSQAETASERLQLSARRTQVHSQSQRFLRMWGRYNQLQVEIKNKTKALLMRRCKTASNQCDDEQIENMIENGRFETFAKKLHLQEDTARRQFDEIQMRHAEFIKLEKSVTLVHSLFMDISQMVSEQGEMVDRISDNVQNAHVRVAEAKENLHKAHKYAVSSRKCKIIMGVVLALILLIFISVLVSEFSNS